MRNRRVEDYIPGGAAGKSMLFNGFARSFTGVNNYFSTPDSVANSIVGDIDIDAKILPDLGSWTATSPVILSKDNGSTQRDYTLAMQAGLIRFFYSTDGVTPKVADSTVNVSTRFTNGTPAWVRATLVVATGTVTFYTSFDGVTYTQLGATVATAAGAIFDGTVLLSVGGLNGTASNNIDVYRARIYNGLRQSAGTLAVDFYPALTYTTGPTFTGITGEVWTPTGTASLRWT
jgi:hypothetical protein